MTRAFTCLRYLLTCLVCAHVGISAAQTAGKEPTLQLSQELSADKFPSETKNAQLSLTPTSSVDIRDDTPVAPTIDLTASPDDLWVRMRNGFSMPDLHSPLVAERQAWYLNHPGSLRVALERSRRYLHHIVSELEKRGMPTELALLPVVESSYNPMAYSSAKALGMWQFIPSTGKNYRLQQNWWLDQRRDIIASTNAALDYLQYIYEMHGDWQLALASYNWGEGAVGRAIAKNKARGLPTDYSSLTMPGETRYYVPKLQAIKNIIAHPELFGFKLDPIPNKPYFGMVGLPADMDVNLAAKLAEIPVAEFIALNPAYQRPVMRSSGSPLVLPADKVKVFTENLEQYSAQEKPLTTWQTYALKKGEKIDAVAARFNMSAAQLRQINSITPRTKIHPGFVLLVPAAGATSADTLHAKLPQTPEASAKGKRSKRGSAKAGKRSKGKSASRGKTSAGKKSSKPAAKTSGKKKKR